AEPERAPNTGCRLRHSLKPHGKSRLPKEIKGHLHLPLESCGRLSRCLHIRSQEISQSPTQLPHDPHAGFKIEATLELRSSSEIERCFRCRLRPLTRRCVS